jgi:hypothetical protein
MAIVRKANESDNEKLSLEINNGDYKALKTIRDKFDFADEEAVLRYALAVLTKSETDTLYVDDGTGNKTGLTPSSSLKKVNEEHGQE